MSGKGVHRRYLHGTKAAYRRAVLEDGFVPDWVHKVELDQISPSPVSDSYVQRRRLLTPRSIEAVSDGIGGAGRDVAQTHVGRDSRPLALVCPATL